MIDGPQSRVLITGRELQVLDQVGVLAKRIEVPVMAERECLTVIEKHVGLLGRDSTKAIKFLARVGHLPMAVEIGARLARDRGWDWLLDSTGERIAPVLQRGRRLGRYDSLAVALALSYGRSGKAERMVFDLLGSLPPGGPFVAQDVEAVCPASVLSEIGRCEMDIPTLLHKLCERSLLQRLGKETYRLHAVAQSLVTYELDRVQSSAWRSDEACSGP